LAAASNSHNNSTNVDFQTIAEGESLTVTTQQRVSQNAAFLVIFGVLLGMLGVIAIAAPLAAGVAATMFVGLMVLSRGIMQLYYGIKVRHWGRRFGTYMGIGSLVVGALSVATGGLLMINPVAGVQFLTLMLSLYLVIAGGFEMLHAIEMGTVRGWPFLLLTGFLTVLLGIILWRQWPLSGQWAIGVIVGSSFILSGISLAMLGIAARGNSGRHGA
jgi:uncharacterized membrane protein HdeD (DUF308 family)